MDSLKDITTEVPPSSLQEPLKDLPIGIEALSEELLKSNGKSEIEDLVIVAVNKALEKAKAKNEEEMAKVAQGMMPNIGGLGNLFGK